MAFNGVIANIEAAIVRNQRMIDNAEENKVRYNRLIAECDDTIDGARQQIRENKAAIEALRAAT